jgi:hypothetical protein
MAYSKDSAAEEGVVTTTCSWNCGYRCLLEAFISSGKVSRIETDERPMPSLRAHPRGFSQKEVVYTPDRLIRPWKRIGARGSGPETDHPGNPLRDQAVSDGWTFQGRINEAQNGGHCRVLGSGRQEGGDYVSREPLEGGQREMRYANSGIGGTEVGLPSFLDDR